MKREVPVFWSKNILFYACHRRLKYILTTLSIILSVTAQATDHSKSRIELIALGDTLTSSEYTVSSGGYGKSSLFNIDLQRGTPISVSLKAPNAYGKYSFRLNQTDYMHLEMNKGYNLVLPIDISSLGYFAAFDDFKGNYEPTSFEIIIKNSIATQEQTNLCYSDNGFYFSHYVCVANTGNDANPGTQFLPLKTIARAIEVTANGDGILLKRGDIFHESINVNNRIIAGYGIGNRPILSGYFTPVEQWKQYNDSIWVLDLSNKKIGYQASGKELNIGHIRNKNTGIIYMHKCRFLIDGKDEHNASKRFDEASSCTRYDFNLESKHNSSLTIEDYRNHYGRRYEYYGYPISNFDFYQCQYYPGQKYLNDSIISESTCLKIMESLYMQSNIDPSNLPLEMAAGNHGIRGDNLNIDGIEITGFGMHGICGNFINVIDCYIHDIGGSQQLQSASRWARYGNGIETWNMNGNIIRRNIIRRCYEEALTLQNNTIVTIANSTLCENKIESNIGISSWVKRGSKIINSSFKDNIIKVFSTDILNTYRGYQTMAKALCIAPDTDGSQMQYISLPYINNMFIGGPFISAAIGLSEESIYNYFPTMIGNRVFLDNEDYIVRHAIGAPSDFLDLQYDSSESSIKRYQQATGDTSTTFTTTDCDEITIF